MPLIVENGSGRPDADAYVSLADADAYFAIRNPAWGGFTNEQREAAIRFATGWIDASYMGLWKGYRANELQALAWPRDNSPGNSSLLLRGPYPRTQAAIYDLDGFAIRPDMVPRAVVRACIETALLSAQGFDFVAGGSTVAVKQTSQSVDRVSFTETYETAVTQRSVKLQAIDGLLAGLLTSRPGAGFATVRMVRA